MRSSAQFGAVSESYSSNFDRGVGSESGAGTQGTENELKQQLFSQMKNAGVLNSLKSQLRAKLYDQLRLKNERVDVNLRETQNRLTFKVAVSLVADLMKKSDMPYALSVFLPESGITQEILSKQEMIDVLGLQTDEYIESVGDTTPLINDIIDRVKAQKSLAPGKTSSSCQTEDISSEMLSLDEKLRRIDQNFLESKDMERAAPFKSLEQRMLKYKQECEARFQNDLQTEIRRLKEFEVSRIRIEEAAKYRDKMEAFRQEMENLHLDKVRELKTREENAMERIRSREVELEKAAYAHRQQVLKEEENMRYRESDVKRTVEMELLVVKNEKDRMAQTVHDYEQKIVELENFKLRLEKQHVEDLERFKSDYQRQYKDQDFEIHRRRLAADEDEHRLNLEKERLMRIETRCQAAEKELEELRTDYKKITDDNVRINRENGDHKEQLRILNENLKRQTELSQARERESNSLNQENSTLKSLMDNFKADAANLKENQNSLIANLRKQLDETNDMISSLKDAKHREFKKLREKCDEDIRRETDKYQFEYDRLREEINMFQRRLGQEETLNKQLAVQNTKLGNNLSDLRGQIVAENGAEEADLFRGVASFYPPQSLDGVGASNAVEGEEILERKKAWAELEREQNEVKRNIKSLMRFEPGTRVIEDPGLADRVTGVRMAPQTYETAEDLATEKRMESQFNSGKEASPAQPVSRQARSGATPQEKVPTRVSQESASSNSRKDTGFSGGQKRQWTVPSQAQEDEKSDYSPKPKSTSFKKPIEEKKQSTGSFADFNSRQSSQERPNSSALEPPSRKEEPSPPKQTAPASSTVTGSKPKLFKASTNPFAKRTTTSNTTTAPGFGGLSDASQPPKSDGLFYPGAPSQAASKNDNQFSSITSFGAKKDSNSGIGAGSGLRQSVDKERKSSSNIEEQYSDDGFEEESLGNSQLNPSQPSQKTPVGGMGWGSSGAGSKGVGKQDNSSNLDEFSVDGGFEDKYEDEDFL